MRTVCRRRGVRFDRSFQRWLFAVGLAFFAALLPAAGGCRADDEPGLPADWKFQARIPQATGMAGQVFGREGRVRLWVDMGWLIVRRTTAEDDFEWQVVLARASDPQKPEVKTDRSGNVDIRYRQFFIRESSAGRFRILREAKTADSPAWPMCDDQGPVEGGSGRFTSWHADGWKFVRVCPSFVWQANQKFEPSDVWFRFQPANWADRLVSKNERWRQGGNANVRSGPDDSLELVSRNDSSYLKFDTVSLEDDLIVGSRVTLDQAARGVTGKLLQDCLLTTDAQAIDARSWLNSPEPIAVEKLPGKVVLLVFWSAKCRRSVAQLAQVEALQQKYAERGLVAIGVHPPDGSENVAGLLKERGVTFPVAIDAAAAFRPYTGETATRYGARSDPAYFLIDKTGKIDLGLGMEPPTDAEIERLLLQDGVPPPLAVRAWLNTAEPLALDKLAGRPVLLTFLHPGQLTDLVLSRPRSKVAEITALASKFGPDGLVTIGVFRHYGGIVDVPALLQRGKITFPVLIDTGEATTKAYRIPDAGSASFLIGKDGKLRGGLRRTVTESEVEELLK